jgi:hypothetical protein
VLATIRESFTIVTMGEHATSLSSRSDLRRRDAGPVSAFAPAAA